MIDPNTGQARVLLGDTQVQLPAGRYQLTGDLLQVDEAAAAQLGAVAVEPSTPESIIDTSTWWMVGGAGLAASVSAGIIYWASTNAGGSDDQNDDAGSTNQAPTLDIASTISWQENVAGNLGMAVASDPEGDDVRYSLKGADKTHFSIDRLTGQISANAALDYDARQDFDADNQFDLTVIATDAKGATTSRALVVQLTDVDDEAPEIAAITTLLAVDEGWAGVVQSLSANDPDSSQSDISWHLSGADAGYFSVTSAGNLVLDKAKNFEAHADENTDGVYEVGVLARDRAGNQSAVKNFQVEVLDVWEPQFTSTLDLFATLNALQRTYGWVQVDDIDFSAVIKNQDIDDDDDDDGDSDDDADALVVFVDYDGVTATSDAPSMLVAALDDSCGQDPATALWIYGASHAGLSQIVSATSARVAGTQNDHQLTLNGPNGQLEFKFESDAFDRSIPSAVQHDPTTQILLHSDTDSDGVYNHFWVIDTTGTYWGGDDDGGSKQIVSNLLVATDTKRFAAGDVDGDGDHDIVVFDRVADNVDVWLFDSDNETLDKATGTDNPFYGAAISGLLAGGTTSSDIDHIDLVEDDGLGNTGLMVSADEAAWLLS